MHVTFLLQSRRIYTNYNANGVARMLKSYAHQRETTGSVSLFNYYVPIQKRKEYAHRGSEFFPLRAVPYCRENYFYHIR